MSSLAPRLRLGTALVAVAAGLAMIPASGLAVSASADAQPKAPRGGHHARAWGARLGSDPGWFTDPLSPAQRSAEVAIPRSPATLNGTAKRYTVARLRTHSGALAVPARQAYGHQLVTGQALTFAGASLFHVGSARLTTHARTVVTRLAYSMSDVASVTCEGYTDFGSRGLQAYRPLSQRRAASLCRALAAQTDLTTRAVAYASTRPAVVGSRNPRRNANRRAVVVVTGNVGSDVPTITEGSSSLNNDTGDWDFHLTWDAPDSAGSPVTGYEWSLDGSTWSAFDDFTAGSPNTGTFDSGFGACTEGTSPVYVRALTAGGAGQPSDAVTVPYGFQGIAPAAAARRRC